jgi:ribonuclease T2
MNGRRGQMLRAAVFLCGMFLANAAQAEDAGYVLALSWQADFCAGDAGSSKAECRTAADNDRLVLHGLWPNADRNSDGRLDEADDYCLTRDRARMIAADRTDWRKLPPVELGKDLQERLTDIMPGVQSQLERHQWIKHGTCSGLGAGRYFAAAVSLAEDAAQSGFAAFIAKRSGKLLARRDVLQAFAAEFGTGSDRALQLICRRDGSGASLSEIRLRLKVDRIEAPLARQSLDTAKPAKGNCPARFGIERG